jgi:paraquat-inducible protein B
MISAANATLVSARGTLNNANTYLEPDSVKSQQLEDTLQQVNRAARSIRLLTDYLQRHPEALLRGKRGEAQ